MPRSQWEVRGYKYVTLHIDKKHKGFQVHRLVAAAFLGPSDLVVNHKNGKKGDNRLENLEYIDAAGNRAHAMHVLDAYPRGSRHPNAKLTEDNVREILRMIAAGISNSKIAPLFNCTAANIYYIRKGLAWSRLGESTPPKASKN